MATRLLGPVFGRGPLITRIAFDAIAASKHDPETYHQYLQPDNMLTAGAGGLTADMWMVVAVLCN
jgi:hypothetical protein